jgi:hypothetical protein
MVGKLMLHCGAQAATREQLAQVPTPPSMGRFHQPWPFIDYIELADQELRQAGFEMIDEAYGLTPNHMRFFGLMSLRAPIPINDEEYELVVGLRGAHDQSFSRSMATGDRVFVCDNLAFNATHTFSTKQTINITARVPELLHRMVAQLPEILTLRAQQIDDFKLRQLTDTQADALMTNLVRQHVVPSSKLSELITEWDTPRYEEHAEDGLTLWRMHNAVTEVLKPSEKRGNLFQLEHRTVKLNHILDQAA